jgi:hypothetical protein
MFVYTSKEMPGSNSGVIDRHEEVSGLQIIILHEKDLHGAENNGCGRVYHGQAGELYVT